MDTRWKEYFATKIFKFNRKRYMDQPPVWMIYEKRCEKAQDNGYYLFRYCMENDMEKALNRQIYYVIDKHAVDYKKVSKYGRNILKFMSLRYMVYMLRCQLLISSDARNHSYVWQNQDSLLVSSIRRKNHVFLGHGVLALKRLNESFEEQNMRSVLCTVTSDAEARIFREELGFGYHQVAVAGYPRFDALEDKSENYREILVMPTHRRWVFGIEREKFVESEYYKRYMELINSPHLMEQLEKHDLTLNFYLHPSIGEHIDAFTGGSDRVKIIPYGEYALDDLMMRCKLLVTDYSSISWDLFYMGKPIVLYQFDMEDYLNTWGSYIDLRKDSPGERAETADELLQAIDDYIENGFVMKKELEAKRADMFAYLDTDNSARVCKALKDRNL
jgi:CDP-glycerol glycerophosphotransferase (TagB/SpsB family)